MKKLFILFIVSIFALAILNAQDEAPPQAFSYKATITKSNGAIVPNKTIGLKISILPEGYVETFTPSTNLHGQIDIKIGLNGNFDFSDIDWSTGEHFLEVSIDVKGGTDYEFMSSTQLLSVPYALYAGGTIESDPVFISSDAAEIDFDDITNWNSAVLTSEIDQTIDGIKTFNNDLFVNGLTVGRGNNSNLRNTAFGFQALSSNTTGYDNIAIGYQALWKNTTGTGNIANGNWALSSNQTGHQNTAFGTNALYSNTTANSNTAVGHFALGSNKTGASNTAVGVSALGANQDGFGNTATGNLALASNTIGKRNTGNGDQALYSNTTGNSNTATGHQALNKNTSGYQNTAVGMYALRVNETGNNNTANGRGALISNTTGSQNTANGAGALISNATGSYNTSIGFFSGFTNEAGNNNVFIGNRAGYYETESNKLFIDNQQRTDETDARTKSLIYGVFDADPENQILTINGKVGIGTITPASKLDVKGEINVNSNKIINVANPVNDQDVATKGYVDASASGGGWSISGNAGTDPSNHFLGTTDDNPIVFRVNNIERMRLNSNGNLAFSGASNSVFIGDGAGANDDLSNNRNVFIGVEAGNSNTGGYYNTATGYQALNGNETGLYNTADGYMTLPENTFGEKNTATGFMALRWNETGNFNTAVGSEALFVNISGSSNTAVGFISGPNRSNLNNTGAFGYGAEVIASNTYVFGNQDVVGWGFGVTPGSVAIKVGTSTSNGNGATLTLGGVWTNASDLSKKYDIEDINYGLADVMKLHPVTYKLKGGNNQDIGFIAQEVRGILPEIVYGEEGQMTMSYGQVTSVLVKAIQEQQQMIKELQQEIEILKNK